MLLTVGTDRQHSIISNPSMEEDNEIHIHQSLAIHIAAAQFNPASEPNGIDTVMDTGHQ
jgi:hypothetical protein